MTDPLVSFLTTAIAGQFPETTGHTGIERGPKARRASARPLFDLPRFVQAALEPPLQRPNAVPDAIGVGLLGRDVQATTSDAERSDG